jgi:hypothetical protein
MNMRLVSGFAGRFVEQQLEQLAVLEPEQQQSDEREQQYRIPRGKPLKESGTVASSHVPNSARFPWVSKLTGPCRAQGLPDHPACPALESGQAKKKAWAAVSSNCRKPRPSRSLEAVPKP